MDIQYMSFEEKSEFFASAGDSPEEIFPSALAPETKAQSDSPPDRGCRRLFINH
jgi:hypothetical protein